MNRPVGADCPYKKMVCNFKGECQDCPVWKAKELATLQKDGEL